MTSGCSVCVCVDRDLAAYGFGPHHPFNNGRLGAFEKELYRSGLEQRITLFPSRQASQVEIERFHSHEYVEEVKAKSVTGTGYLDMGDTPAFPGVYEAAARVVGTALDAVREIVQGRCRRAFLPIGGLHHARRDSAAGFCVFNDCGVVIESLRHDYGVGRVAYVDIDAHHGDGVFYAFEHDPQLFFADIHEDGRFLYPGTGGSDEIGLGAAAGTKLNIPMPMQANDADFMGAWDSVERLIQCCRPEFILLQCGADSVRGDPLAHLQYTPEVHAHAARRLCILADTYCNGRLLAFGGGGYEYTNLAQAWTGVVRALAVEVPERV